MTYPDEAWANIADGAATVGVQAQTVHGDVRVYQVPPDASPEQKYQVGVNYLDGGMPTRARQLIDEAVAGGHLGSEVRFHWWLALLSGRTIRQLSDEDLAKLRAVSAWPRMHVVDEWTDGLRVISRLLDCVEAPEADFRTVMKEFDELGTIQRDKILRHLDLFLAGPVKDQVWYRTVRQVEEERFANDRGDRVWMFFQPRPARPRVLQPVPVATTLSDRILTGTATALFAATAGYLGVLATQTGSSSTIAAGLVAVIGGYTSARYGVEWRYRVVRQRARDDEFRTVRQPATNAQPEGFAHKVDRLFSRYFARYVPYGEDRRVWLEHTAGIRQVLRDEIVEAYRETRVGADQVAWLIRHRVSDVKVRWQNGTLLGYRGQFRASVVTRVLCVLGLVALALGGVWSIGAAVQARPLGASVALALAVATGRTAAVRWLRMAVERKRFAAEVEEARQRLDDSTAAYARWRRRLERKPLDAEMAAWLDCDRKVLMEWALRHYKLDRSDVIGHAFIEAPAAPYRRARVARGPWRYSRYRLMLFLLTSDGVRQVTADLDFEKGAFHDRQRTNYRFDAVTSVEVTETDGDGLTFDLTLVNGQAVTVRAAEPDPEPDADASLVSEVTMDAAGLKNTLHVLEGIAAEGKDWITYEKRRAHGRIAVLRSAAHGMLD